jgi:hypothetical protein
MPFVMTLILTIANRSGIYQSCDYQITNEKGKLISDEIGTKQVDRTFKNFSIRLTFTGIAYGYGQKERTIDFLTDELGKLPNDSSLPNLCDKLSQRCELTVPLRQPLTIVISVVVLKEPYKIVIISNKNWQKIKGPAKTRFFTYIHKVKKPYINIQGYLPCVSQSSKTRLKILSKIIGKTTRNILKELEEINIDCAQNSNGYVSKKCWVGNFTRDADEIRVVGRNFGGQGVFSSIFQGVDMGKWIKNNVTPSKKLSIDQTSTVINTKVSPMPIPIGEHKNFIISGEKIEFYINSPTNKALALVTFRPIESIITMQCNTVSEFNLAEVEITALGKDMEDFPKSFDSLSVTPIIFINKYPLPPSYIRPIDCYVENGICHLIFPVTSFGGIRNTVYLNEDEEIVIVTPIKTSEYTFNEPKNLQKLLLTCRFWFQKIRN